MRGNGTHLVALPRRRAYADRHASVQALEAGSSTASTASHHFRTSRTTSLARAAASPFSDATAPVCTRAPDESSLSKSLTQRSSGGVGLRPLLAALVARCAAARCSTLLRDSFSSGSEEPSPMGSSPRRHELSARVRARPRAGFPSSKRQDAEPGRTNLSCFTVKHPCRRTQRRGDAWRWARAFLRTMYRSARLGVRSVSGPGRQGSRRRHAHVCRRSSLPWRSLLARRDV